MSRNEERNCLICFSEGQIGLPLCDCTYCEDCISKWVSSSIRRESFDVDAPAIVCPNYTCNTAFKLNEFRSQLSGETDNLIERDLLNVYLRKAGDIRNCPSNECNYYGIIEKNTCNKPLVCEACGNEWWDKEHFSRNRKFLQSLRQFFFLENEIFSTIYEEVFAKACPGCEINIIRNGGCPHITCKKCGYEFCWYCKQKYSAHQLNVCTAHVLVKIIIISIIIFNICYKIGLITKLCSLLYTLFYAFIKYVFFMNLFFVFFFLSLYTAYASIKSRAPRNSCQSYLVGFLHACTFLYCGLFFYYGYFKEAVYFFCIEIVSILLMIPVYFIYETVVYSWLLDVA